MTRSFMLFVTNGIGRSVNGRRIILCGCVRWWPSQIRNPVCHAFYLWKQLKHIMLYLNGYAHPNGITHFKLFPISCNNVALQVNEINNDLFCHYMWSSQVKNDMNKIIWIEFLIKTISPFAYILQVTRELDSKLSFTGYFRPKIHRQKFVAV